MLPNVNSKGEEVVSIAIHLHGEIHQTIMSSRTNEASPGSSKADYILIHQVMGTIGSRVELHHVSCLDRYSIVVVIINHS
jgi:hypothetical protein